MSNVFDKEKYVLHYENFTFYSKLGLKLKKKIIINHVLEFDQSQWSTPYIEFNKQKKIETEKNWK